MPDPDSTQRRVSGAGGVQLMVRDVGDPTKPPLLLLHGLTQSSMAWQRQLVSDLSDDYRLVAVDLRGHGDSEKPRASYGRSRDWADDVQAVIVELELDRPVVVAWSYAGIIVCDYVRAYGCDGIAGLNLVGAATRVGSPEATSDLGDDAVPRGFVSADCETAVAALSGFIRASTFHPLPAADFCTFLGFNVQTPPHVRVSMLERVAENDDVLASISVPVLVSQGDGDRVVLPHASARVSALIRDATLSSYHDVGHCPFWEASARFNDELRAFSSGCRRA